MKGQATTQGLPEGAAPPSKRKWLKVLFFLILLVVGGGAALWKLGSSQPHQPATRPLHSSFDQSTTHKKLLSQLQKSKLSIVSGKVEDGLLHFAQHLANRLSQKGPVYVQDLGHEYYQYFKIAQQASGLIGEVIGHAPVTGDLILLSIGGVIAEEILKEIIENNPDARIVLVSSVATKIKGFKNFDFPQVEEKLLEGIIAKSLGVKPQVADILHDYFGSTDAAFHRVNGSKFDHKQVLGDNHKPLDGLTKEDKATLQGLCSKGTAKSKKESAKLLELGVVYLDGVNYWKSLDSILNYELAAGVNCKNTVATPSIIESAQAARAKAEEEQKAREQAERKKEEERKAAEQQKKAADQEKKKAAEAQVKQSSKKQSTKEKAKPAKKSNGKAKA